MNEKDQEIIKGFAEAGLKAVPAERPLFWGPGAGRVFGLQVKGRGKSVHFEFWSGAEDNRVQILNTDPKYRQLVLLVKEAPGVIKTREYDRDLRKRVVRETRVPGQTRRFLLGFDERDLFLCQLPAAARITTVRQAHEVLRTPGLPTKKKVVRQGEWFFSLATKEDLEQIAKNKLVVKKKWPISGPGRGKPHTADEYVEILGKDLPPLPPETGIGRMSTRRFSAASNKGTVLGMFVRGKVRHLDHATVEFHEWHKVVRNTEDRGANARWID